MMMQVAMTTLCDENVDNDSLVHHFKVNIEAESRKRLCLFFRAFINALSSKELFRESQERTEENASRHAKNYLVI